jgi:tetratricopeptide (TPR) repeat protein
MRELLADVLYSSGKLQEAKQTLTDAVRLFPRNRSLSRKRVELLERANDLDGVSAEYARVIAQYPDEVDFYVDYGQFLARNKKLDQARNQWKHVLDREVTDTTLANRLGSLFVQFELYDDAADCYRRAMNLDSKRPESYTALSRLLFLQGQRTKAIEVLDQMAQANPDDAAFHARLSQALLLLSFPEKALQAIARSCELNPEQYRYQMAYADLLLQTGETDRALQVRRKVIDLIKNGPQQMKAIDVLVSLYDSAGTLQQLMQNEGERLKGGHRPVSLLLLARASDLERDFVSSRRYLDKLLQADPGHEEGHKQLASLHYALGDIQSPKNRRAL